MRHRPFVFVLIAALAACLPNARLTQAQPTTAAPDSASLWRIQTIDDNEFVGTIEEETEEHVRLRTESLGVITIPRNQIRTMEPINPSRIVNGELWADNPQATRYFWGPNGFGLRAGEGYYQNVWVFFNQFAFGLSDYASIGVGIVPLFLFEGAPSPIWITPKISLPLSSAESGAHLGAGGLFGLVAGADEAGFGIAYGTLTVGSRDKNVSLGLGYGYADGNWGEKPALTLSTMMRVGRRSYFVSENYLIDSVAILSLGGRFVGRNMSFDYGLFIPVEDGSINVAVPWIGVVVPLKK